MSDKNRLLGGITAKLSMLMGGAIAVTGAQASTPPVQGSLAEPSNNLTISAEKVGRDLPAKLTLKQQNNGFKLIAQHDSHSSHSSHASHASHSSHSSRAV
jgi:hypothetical protein